MPSRWRNPNTGNAGAITPTRTYRSAAGIYCREYQLTAPAGGRTGQAHGSACRQPDGSWRVSNQHRACPWRPARRWNGGDGFNCPCTVSSRSGSIRFRYAGESQSLSQRRARADAEEGVPARFRIHAIPETDMHDPESDIRDIPLSQLELSPGNVRKTPADASAFTELKASIAAHGLLENLIARAMEPGTDCVARYAVIAGGRRLAAMQALAAEGALEEDHPVPCRMIEDIVAAEEVSLAENTVRAAMHPADQVEAFRRLADAGSTAAAIAARFGVSERTVEKRLRLGNAAPVLLEAYRAGEIDLDTLMAFAVTTDQARQNAVWETVSQQGYRPGAWQIKRLLTEDRLPATSAIARFVGIEAYEAADGRIDRDLFAEEDERGIWLDDPDLLNKLAMDSLQAAARELETRWKWTEVWLDVDWSATASFGRVRPQPAEPTDEEKAEIERLRTRNDKLANMDDDGWTEELVEEADANETRLDEIEATIEARAVYRRGDIAIAGCIATVGNDGELKLIQGLVRPEDMPARESGEADAAGHDDTGDEENTISGIDAPTFVAPLASPGDAEAEARKEAGVGIGLADDLRAIRTAIVKSQLACDFCPSSKQMGLLSVFHKGGSGSSLFDVKPLGVDGSSGGFGWSVF